MSLCKFPDVVELVKTKKNKWGDEVIHERVAVKAIFHQGTGWTRGSYSNPITSDAIAYIDHRDEWVISNAFRLEEFKVVASPFGSPDNLSWYKVAMVDAPKKSLTTNKLDHCLVQLDKTVEIKDYVPS